MNLKSMTLEELNALAARKHAEMDELQNLLRQVNDRRRVVEAKMTQERIVAMTPEQLETRRRNSRTLG